MSLRLEDIQAFLNVVELGSISAAAERMSLSKSVISKRVSDLERHLGVRLPANDAEELATYLLTRVIADAVAEGLMTRHGVDEGGDTRAFRFDAVPAVIVPSGRGPNMTLAPTAMSSGALRATSSRTASAARIDANAS